MDECPFISYCVTDLKTILRSLILVNFVCIAKLKYPPNISFFTESMQAHVHMFIHPFFVCN